MDISFKVIEKSWEGFWHCGWNPREWSTVSCLWCLSQSCMAQFSVAVLDCLSKEHHCVTTIVQDWAYLGVSVSCYVLVSPCGWCEVTLLLSVAGSFYTRKRGASICTSFKSSSSRTTVETGASDRNSQSKSHWIFALIPLRIFFCFQLFLSACSDVLCRKVLYFNYYFKSVSWISY